MFIIISSLYLRLKGNESLDLSASLQVRDKPKTVPIIVAKPCILKPRILKPHSMDIQLHVDSGLS